MTTVLGYIKAKTASSENGGLTGKKHCPLIQKTKHVCVGDRGQNEKQKRRRRSAKLVVSLRGASRMKVSKPTLNAMLCTVGWQPVIEICLLSDGVRTV